MNQIETDRTGQNFHVLSQPAEVGQGNAIHIIHSVFFFVTKNLKWFGRIPGAVQFFDLVLFAVVSLFAPRIAAAIAEIETTVESWPGVSLRGHRFGGTEFNIAADSEEFGHIHGCGVIDLKLPAKTIEQLPVHLTNLIQPHHVAPGSQTWATLLVDKEDMADAMQILHIAYEIALSRAA